jgi:hypothetical protein
MSIRLTPALRRRLDEERKKEEPSRSMTQEIETRLRLSFEEMQRRQDALGGPTNYWLALSIAAGINAIEREMGARWFEDRKVFDECGIFISEFLSHFRPTKSKKRPRAKPVRLGNLVLPPPSHSPGRRAAQRAFTGLSMAAMAGAANVDLPNDVFAAVGVLARRIKGRGA